MSAGRRTTETVADREKAMESAVLTERSTPAHTRTDNTPLEAMLQRARALKSLNTGEVAENVERSCGRGLFLMRCYSKWMRFIERGNRLTLGVVGQGAQS
jgi:hypothetical protein